MGAVQKTRVLGFGGKFNGNSGTHRLSAQIHALHRIDGIYKGSHRQSAFPLLDVAYTVQARYNTFPTPILEPSTRSRKCSPALRAALELLLGHGSGCYSKKHGF